MSEGIRASIQVRWDTIITYYDVNGAVKAKVEDYFARLEQFSLTCTDQADFEQKFAASPLNQEYMDLFAELAPYVKRSPEDKTNARDVAKTAALDFIGSNVAGRAKREAKSLIINNVSDDVSNWMIYKENMIPGVSELKTVDNIAEMTGIKKLFRKKEKSNDT